MLAACFDALTPAMDTSDFEACVALQSEVAAMWGPVVLVGSSYGGAVATALLQRGLWRGPTLLLANAALRRGLDASLPPGVRVHAVHAAGDEIVPIADSRAIQAANPRPEVTLAEVDDDHALTRHTQSGALVAWVRELAR